MSSNSPSTKEDNSGIKLGWTVDQRDLASVLIIFGLIVAVATIGSQGAFLQPQNLLNILQQNAILLVLAVAQFFVVLIRGIDLSVGAIVAFTSVVFIGFSDYGVVAGLIAAIVAGVLIGILNGSLVTFLRLPPFVTTLGTMQIIYSLAKVISGGGTLNSSFAGAPIPSFITTFYGQSLLGVPLSAIVFIVVFICAALFLRSGTGHFLTVIGANERMARLVGIRVRHVRLLTYALAGGISAIGGALFAARVGYGDPQAGLWLPLDTIAAVCIGGASLNGGRGTLTAVAFGVLIIAILNNAMNLVGLPPTAQPAVKGVIILLTVYLYSRRSSEA